MSEPVFHSLERHPATPKKVELWSEHFINATQGDHVVHFYENEEELAELLTGYAGSGIACGETALLISTDAHWSQIKSKLQSRGFNVDILVGSGQIVWLDAAETLSRFMRDGMPDELHFDQVIGALVQGLRLSGKRIRGFGEMVALLWADGNFDAALRLEQLWNELRDRHEFKLLCAYPITQFAAVADAERFSHVCCHHAKVIPFGGFSQHLPDEQLRTIAMLQQRAASLEAEIGERRRAEDELRTSREDLREFVENASIGLHWVDSEGIIKWANAADFERLGYTREAYVGRHIAEFHVDQRHIHDILQRLAKGEKLQEVAACLKAKDGSIRHVLIDSCVRWKDGKFVHTQCFTRDITEQKKAEQSLSQLLALMPAGVYACDADGRVTFFNRRAVELWGYEPILGEDCQKYCLCHKVYLPDGTFVPPHETPMAIALREGKSFRGLEALVDRPDGSQFTALVNIDPLHDNDGSVVGAVNVFQDITERKAQQVAVQRLAAIVESSQDAILAMDLDGRITNWNHGAERMYGFGAEEAIGKSIAIILPRERGLEEPAMMERLRKGERIEHFETSRKRKDGTLIDISLTVSPIKDSRGNVIGVSKIGRDITESKKAQRELQKAKEELELRVKERTVSLEEAVAQMEEFSYTVSHDLRGPLRVMQGFCQILMEDAASELSPENLTYLNRIAHSAERLDRLVQDVLTYTRVSRMDIARTEVDLDSLIVEVLRNHIAEQDPAPEIVIERPLLLVIGHEASLLQCLSNLIGNALKFIPAGVVPFVRVWTEPVGNNVRLLVEDNGIGIHPDHVKRVFGMFERAPEAAKYPGTGVGLAIVKKSVQRMQGRIGLESTMGKGTRIWIELPAADSCLGKNV